MCGIAGFCLNPDDHRMPDAAVMAAALLLQIEARGTDATGMAWAEADWRKARLHKAAERASVYVPQHVERMSPEATLSVLHTRMATQGSPKVNGNNHPIVSGSVVGVHNGHISNDDTLFSELGCERLAQVDSEAAFATIAYGEGTITDRLTRLHGRVALAWMDKRDLSKRSPNTLHLARVNGSPLAVGQTKRGSFLFASTMPMLRDAAEMAEVKLVWDLDVPEGVYMKIRDGKMVSYETFEVPRYQPMFSAATLARMEGKHRKAGHRSFSSGKRSGEVKPYEGIGWLPDTDDWRWEDDEFIRDIERSLTAADREV